MISISCRHGLGDAVHLAHWCAVYRAHGTEVEVDCPPWQAFLFRAAGAKIVPQAKYPHPLHEAPAGRDGTLEWPPRQSKLWRAYNWDKLPRLGDDSEVWAEYCRTRLPLALALGAARLEQAGAATRLGVGRQYVLLHTRSPNSDSKSLSERQTYDLQDALEGVGLSVVTPSCHPEQIAALACCATLTIGVDSGPLHLGRCTYRPSLGLWRGGHHPSQYTVPCPDARHIVWEPGLSSAWTDEYETPYSLIRPPDQAWDPDFVAAQALRLVGEPQYLAQASAIDAELREWVWVHAREWHRSATLDSLLRGMRLIKSPYIVETGSVRQRNDYGAGYFGHYLGRYLQARGEGRIDTLEIDPGRAEFARQDARWHSDYASVWTVDSVTALCHWPTAIDLLYCDSLDADQPGSSEHCLAEVRAALPHLTARALILIDDTPTDLCPCPRVGSKGKLAVPWLLERGWRVLAHDWQCLLTRR